MNKENTNLEKHKEIMSLLNKYVLDTRKSKSKLIEKHPSIITCILSRCKKISVCWDLRYLVPNPQVNLNTCKKWKENIGFYSRNNTLHKPKHKLITTLSYQEISLILLALNHLKNTYKDFKPLERIINKLSNTNILKGYS